MTQLQIAPPTTVTVQAAATVSGAVSASGLIKITTSAAHGLSTGAVVQIASVTGTVESNGQWVITVVDTTHYTLNNSTFLNAYVSGGTAAHVGQVTVATALQNPAGWFVSTPFGADAKFVFVLQSAPLTGSMRFSFWDAEQNDETFVTSLPGVGAGFAGSASASCDRRWSAGLDQWPDLRISAEGIWLQLRVLWGTPVAGQTYSYSSWLES